MGCAAVVAVRRPKRLRPRVGASLVRPVVSVTVAYVRPKPPRLSQLTRLRARPRLITYCRALPIRRTFAHKQKSDEKTNPP